MNSLSSLLKADLSVKPGITKTDFISFSKVYFKSPLFRYTCWLRIFHAVKKNRILLYSPVEVLSFILFRHYEYKYGVHISSNIEIGPGLHVVHGDGIYVNVKSIGTNFTVYQNVTFGSVNEMEKPLIKDGVTVNPGAVIYGNVILNDNCVIGANSVVNKDVPEDDIVAGAPAISIRHKNS